MKISQVEYQQIKDLKTLDIQQCSFCHQITILNLGWPAFGKFYCRLHEAEYALCPELCYKVCLNIWGCELYQEALSPRLSIRPVKPNKPYDWASCYLCFKELKSASKKSTIKNRNNPSFWGIKSEWKILCLECLGKRYYSVMEKGKKKTYQKYLKRGYV